MNKTEEETLTVTVVVGIFYVIDLFYLYINKMTQGIQYFLLLRCCVVFWRIVCSVLFLLIRCFPVVFIVISLICTPALSVLSHAISSLIPSTSFLCFSYHHHHHHALRQAISAIKQSMKQGRSQKIGGHTPKSLIYHWWR